jgi:hypothetical protein
MDWVLRFNAQGRIEEALGEVRAKGFDGAGTDHTARTRLLRFTLDGAGRITAVQSDGVERLVASSYASAKPGVREVWSARYEAAP